MIHLAVGVTMLNPKFEFLQITLTWPVSGWRPLLTTWQEKQLRVASILKQGNPVNNTLLFAFRESSNSTTVYRGFTELGWNIRFASS
jgi:hypothetical protein